MSDGVIDSGAVDSLPIRSSWKDASDAWSECDIEGLRSGVMDLATQVGSFAFDPISFLVSNGLNFLIDWIQPLEDALGYVTGNPEKLGTDADGWAAVATELGEIAEDLRSAVNSDLAEWLGDDGDAARQRLSEFASAIDGVTNDVNGIGVVLGLSVALMEAAQAIILTIISAFVSWLIITWLAAFATAELTLGGSTVAAGAATGAESVVATSRVALALERIAQIMVKFRVVLQKIARGLKKYYSFMNRLSEKPIINPIVTALGIEVTPMKISTLNLWTLAKDTAAGEAESLATTAPQETVPGVLDYLDGYQTDADIEEGLSGL